MERLDRPLGNRGEEEEENRVNPFARSSKLCRTPPSTPRPCKEEEHHGTEEVQSKEGGVEAIRQEQKLQGVARQTSAYPMNGRVRSPPK